ncbi:unnamed protein product, partial [Amoebophrya sp. A25]|eukprot:GSA25T00022662001.1
MIGWWSGNSSHKVDQDFPPTAPSNVDEIENAERQEPGLLFSPGVSSSREVRAQRTSQADGLVDIDASENFHDKAKPDQGEVAFDGGLPSLASVLDNILCQLQALHHTREEAAQTPAVLVAGSDPSSLIWVDLRGQEDVEDSCSNLDKGAITRADHHTDATMEDIETEADRRIVDREGHTSAKKSVASCLRKKATRWCAEADYVAREFW